MRSQRRFEFSHLKEWQGFKMNTGKLERPTGQLISPQRILVGIGLLEINSDLEIKISTKL